MENILRTFRDTKVQSFLDSFDSNIKIQIQKDLEHIEVVSNLLSTSKGAKLSRKLLYDELSSVLRFDAGDGSNVVGKIVSATLLIDKLALHSEKLDYMLISAGYDLSSLFDDPDFMREYERTIIRINNLPENHMLLALTENFVIRLAESLTGSEIVTETVFDESFFSK